MENQYKAQLIINGELQDIEFYAQAGEKPIDVLWTRYGMDTYIKSIELIKTPEEETVLPEKTEETQTQDAEDTEETIQE